MSKEWLDFILFIFFFFLRKEFPGCPVVRTTCFSLQWPVFSPG